MQRCNTVPHQSALVELTQQQQKYRSDMSKNLKFKPFRHFSRFGQTEVPVVIMSTGASNLPLGPKL